MIGDFAERAELQREISMNRVALAIASVIALVPCARADFDVSLDCHLDPAWLACQDVRSALGASLPGAVLRESASSLRIDLRDVGDGSAQRYRARFRGAAGGQPVQFALATAIPHAAGRERALALVTALLHRGLMPFASVGAPGRNEGGALVIEATFDPAAPPTTSDASAWYARPRISGEMVDAGLIAVEVDAGLSVGFSEPDWRYRLEGTVRYRYLDLALGETRLEGGFYAVDANTLIARALAHNLSLGGFASVRREPHNNLDLRAAGGVGLEWVMSPFLATNDTNVGVRATVSGLYDDYASPNVENADHRTFVQPALLAFARVHVDVIDLEVQARGDFVIDRPRYWSVGGSAIATIRLWEGLALTVDAGVTYRGGAVHAPRDPQALDSLAVASFGSNFNELTLDVELGLSWTIGNALRMSQDQRWR